MSKNKEIGTLSCQEYSQTGYFWPAYNCAHTS